MRHTLFASVLLVVGCHTVRSDDKPLSQSDVCRNCCQQAQDACKLDNDHPGYYCPKGMNECVTACAENNENEMCVLQTNKQFAATAPRRMPQPAPPETSFAPPVAAVNPVAQSARGECDNRGTWKLHIGDAKGHAVGCAGLTDVPRDVNFRIERQREQYALRDLIPARGWQDGFAVQNHEDVCVVMLKRDNHTDEERARLMTVQLSEKDGVVQGTFHYREELKQPVACQLDALVTGIVEAPAPQASPPQQLPPQPPPPPSRIMAPQPGAPRVGGGAPAQQSIPAPHR